MKLEHFLTPYKKLNSKQIKDLSERPETITLGEENMEANLHDFGFGSDFLNKGISDKNKQT